MQKITDTYSAEASPTAGLTDQQIESLWTESTGASWMTDDMKAFARNVWGAARDDQAHLLANGSARENDLAGMIGEISDTLGLTETEQFEANGANKILARITALLADESKFRQHSILLNRALWQMLEMLGEISPGADEHFADAEDTIHRFFVKMRSADAPGLQIDNSRCKFASGGACCVSHCGDPACLAALSNPALAGSCPFCKSAIDGVHTQACRDHSAQVGTSGASAEVSRLAEALAEEIKTARGRNDNVRLHTATDKLRDLATMSSPAAKVGTENADAQATELDMPEDDAAHEAWVSACEVDGIKYSGSAFERGYELALSNGVPEWPTWASQILKVVREHSGYDGYDDQDGVDLVEETSECLRELAAMADRARADLKAAPQLPEAMAPAAPVAAVGEAPRDQDDDFADRLNDAYDRGARCALDGVQEVSAGFDDLPFDTCPAAWGEKPFARIRSFYDSGDESVGQPSQSGWTLSEDQSGTVVGDLAAFIVKGEDYTASTEEEGDAYMHGWFDAVAHAAPQPRSSVPLPAPVDESADLHGKSVDEIADLHPATRDLVDRFARALAEKLAAAEKKYGYSDGWADPDWLDECRQHLTEHVAKGDLRDVAAYCAFLWHHGASTADPAQPAPNAEPTVAECIMRLDIWNGKLEAAIDRQALEQLGQHANDEPFVVGRDPMEQLP